MDPLLLLCNLYADGPATLRRLKTRGVQSLANVAVIAPDRLAEYIGGSPAAARRFQREAALAARVKPQRDLEEGAILEPLGCEPTAVEASTAAPLDEVRAPVESRAHMVSRTPPVAAPVSPVVRRSLRIPAMPLDEIAPRAPSLSHKVDSPLAAEFRGTLLPRCGREPASRDRDRGRADERATITPHAPRSEPQASDDGRQPPLDSSTLLRPGLCTGLHANVCAKLIGEGIRTLAQLVRVPTQPLAGWIGLTPEAFEALRERAIARMTPDASAIPASRPAARSEIGPEHDDGSAGERIHELTPQPRATPIQPPMLAGLARPAGPVRSVWNDRALPQIDKSLVPLARRALPAFEDVAGPFA